MYALMADRDTLLEFRIGRAWGHHDPRGRNGNHTSFDCTDRNSSVIGLALDDNLNSVGKDQRGKCRNPARGAGFLMVAVTVSTDYG